MKSLRFVFSLVCANIYNLVLWIALAFVAHVSLSGQGEAHPAFVWTGASAWGMLAALFALVRLAYCAGGESRDKQVAYWIERAEKWERLHRTMLDVNKTMIDDVLTAQRAGLKVKTFLHGCGMQKPQDPQDDDRTAGA